MRAQSGAKKRLWVIVQLVIAYWLLCDNTALLHHSASVALFHASDRTHYYLQRTAMMLWWEFALFFALSYSRALFCCCVPLIFFTGALAAYAEHVQQAPINENLIISVFQTNTGEIQGILGWQLALWLGFCLLVSGVMVFQYLLVYSPPEKGSARIVLGGFFAVITGTFIFVPDDRDFWDFHPYDYIDMATHFLTTAFEVRYLNKGKFDVATLPLSYANESRHPLYVIFIIGEAVRADHLSLNGYARHDTTPQLEKQAGLINFSHVTSCGTSTTVAVPCLLTRATEKRFPSAVGETSFVSIFRKLGFKTYWVSEQPKYSNFASPVSSIAQEAEQETFENNYYSRKSQNISNRLDAIIAGPEANTVVVFHMIGSHWFYEWRYPPEFRRFTPVCMQASPDACSRESLINSYDNTLLYLDDFLAHTIRMLKNKNAVLVYVSDHGEYLGEKGRYLHGQETQDAPLRHVPMLWWASDSFRRLHPDAVARLRSHTDASLSDNNVFPSVLDCAGIASGAVDKKLSLCR